MPPLAMLMIYVIGFIKTYNNLKRTSLAQVCYVFVATSLFFTSTAKLFLGAKFFVIIYLPRVIIQVQTGLEYSAG